MRRVDPDNPSSIRSLARLAGNLNNKPAARNDHTAQPGAEPTLNRFAFKSLALSQLPPMDQLASEFGVSRGTVASVLRKLASEEPPLVRVIPGYGSFVIGESASQ